jgi:hypothetical protein
VAQWLEWHLLWFLAGQWQSFGGGDVNVKTGTVRGAVAALQFGTIQGHAEALAYDKKKLLE